MTEKKYQFNDIYIWNYQHSERIPISADFSVCELIDFLKDEWISFVECHQCGRWGYCKYQADKHHINPNRSKSIQCGVAVKSLEAIINKTIHLIDNADSDIIQDWINGVYHFVYFVYHAELQIGNFLDDDIMSWWSSKVPLAFGQLVKLRDNLDGISKHFSKLNEFKSVESILFVEGKSEKTFLEGLKKSGYASFLYLKIIDYNGTGNSKVKRIHMMIDDYHKRGFKVFIQGDRDGKNKDVFTKLCSKCNIPKENTITFKHDFESSFPIDFLMTSLKTAGLLKNVNKDEIKDNIIKNDVSVVTLLKDNYGIDITDNKVLFAEIASELFFKFYRTWWNDDDFLESELGKFIHFVSKM